MWLRSSKVSRNAFTHRHFGDAGASGDFGADSGRGTGHFMQGYVHDLAPLADAVRVAMKWSIIPCKTALAWSNDLWESWILLSGIRQITRTILDCLQARPEEKMTARQIAEWIFSTYPVECQEKKSNSQNKHIKTDNDLVQQLVAEISSKRPDLQKRYAGLKTTEGRPRKYYYSKKSDSAEIEVAEGITENIINGIAQSTLDEHALYPMLSQYLWEEFGSYSKRINEKRSSNKRGTNGNRWLHPDVVGLEDVDADWHREVRKYVKHYSDKRPNFGHLK